MVSIFKMPPSLMCVRALASVEFLLPPFQRILWELLSLENTAVNQLKLFVFWKAQVHTGRQTGTNNSYHQIEYNYLPPAEEAGIAKRKKKKKAETPPVQLV